MHMAYPSVLADVIEHMVMLIFIVGVRDETVRNTLLLAVYSTTREALLTSGIEAGYKTTATNWG